METRRAYKEFKISGTSDYGKGSEREFGNLKNGIMVDNKKGVSIGIGKRSWGIWVGFVGGKGELRGIGITRGQKTMAPVNKTRFTDGYWEV